MNSLERSFRSRVNNSQGQLFEKIVQLGCEFYREKGIAKITKIAEPFRVLKKLQNGKFEGRFIANAEPDFQGTISGGKSIVFEAKYTSTNKFNVSVLSDQQKESLNEHFKLGGYTFVVIGIKDRQFFVPWEFLRKKIEKNQKSFSKEIYDCKSKKVIYSEVCNNLEDRWSTISPPVEKEIIDPIKLQMDAHTNFLNSIRNRLEITRMVCIFENLDFRKHVTDVIDVAKEFL